MERNTSLLVMMFNRTEMYLCGMLWSHSVKCEDRFNAV